VFYALVHYPDIDTGRINQFRERYDPQVDLIGPHITVVFPVEESVGEQSLASHIESILSGWEPFPIRLKGLLQSRDDHFFLLVEEGRENVIRLYEELYVGMLAPFRREDIPFIPHVTLGVFTGDTVRCAQVLEEAERMELNYTSSVDRFHLVKINDDRSRIVESTEFLLGHNT
jgi:2'-5' RNA ligase